MCVVLLINKLTFPINSGVFLSSAQFCGEDTSPCSPMLQPALCQSEETIEVGRHLNLDDHAGTPAC